MDPGADAARVELSASLRLHLRRLEIQAVGVGLSFRLKAQPPLCIMPSNHDAEACPAAEVAARHNAKYHAAEEQIEPPPQRQYIRNVQQPHSRMAPVFAALESGAPRPSARGEVQREAVLIRRPGAALKTQVQRLLHPRILENS